MFYINSCLKTLIILIIISVSSGCTAKISNNSVDSSCEIKYKSPQNIPNFVLAGTNILDISMFKISTKDLGNNYLADIGGATLTLSIKSHTNNIIIERTFKEPGESMISRIYEPACISNRIIYTEGLIGKLVNGGILILESKPDIDGIPMDLWIYYHEYTNKE